MKSWIRLFPILLITLLFISGLSGDTSKTSTHNASEYDPPVHQLRISGEIHQDQTPNGEPDSLELLKATHKSGQIDKDIYILYLAYYVFEPGKLPPAYQSDAPRRITLALLELQESYELIRDPDLRAKIDQALANTCYLAGDGLTNSYTTPHFYIEYETIYAGLTITDYAQVLETTWITEVDTFGWAAPPVYTPNPPPGNRYHVVIDDLNTIFGGGVYGYVTNNGLHAGLVGDNPNTTWDDADSYATCMALNNNYDPTYFPSPALASLQATAAHEFNHSIQYGYGTLTGGNEVEGNFVEGGATWMEDEVFDTANDNHFYLWPDFDQCMGEYSGDEYAYWITYRGLTEQYGTGAGDAGEQIMQDFWESVSQSSDNNSLDALNQALLVRGETLADSYHRYAVAANFIKPCSGGYVYPYCFEEGAKYLATAGPTSPHGAITTIGDDYSGSVRDFYALNWVDLPTGTEPISVTLKNDSSGGVLQMSLACDTGSSLRVWPMPALAGAGESSTLFYYDRTACTNITAVITNQAQTDPDPSSCPARNYTISTAVSNLTEHHYLPIALR